MKLINKDAFAAKIKKRFDEYSNSILKHYDACKEAKAQELGKILTILNTFEVKYPYEQCVQYDSIKAGIQAHAKTYSFNIESLLFNQLTKEQQVLWRKEIEQACISGGEVGVELARDIRYKENVEVKEVDLTKEISFQWSKFCLYDKDKDSFVKVAKHFFELGLKASNPVAEVNLESLVRQVIDLNLEAGEHYDNIIKEERKECGGSDLAINLLCGTIDAKELGIQYVLEQLKAQKGEKV